MHTTKFPNPHQGAPIPPQVVPKAQASVNYFAQFIEQSGLERRASLLELKGQRLGVDGQKILDSITQVMRDNEKLATLTSPIPYCAYDEMSRLYEVLQVNHIHADYVFPGMGWTFPIKDKEKTKTQDHNATILSLVGRQVGPHDHVRLSKAAEELQATLDEDAENYIFLYMKMFRGTPTAAATVTRAPYWSWAQLASYFNGRTQYISHVYGSHELLGFKGIDTVITRINGNEGTYHSVSKKELLQKLNSVDRRGNFTEDDLPFLIGATSNHRLLNDPFVQNMPVAEFLTGRSARDGQNQLMFNGQGTTAVQQERAQRVADSIRLCPILLPDGRCIPLCMAHDVNRFSKRRLVDLFGEPLPAMYYYMQMSGLLSPSILSTVATKKIVDAAPVVDSPEYRSVAEFIIPLRTQIVYQLVQSLHRPHNIEITWVRRYNREANSRELPILQPPQIRLDEWNTQPISKDAMYFTDVIPYAQSAVSQHIYRTTHQANSAVLLKILDLLGYFTHATQTNSTEVSGPSVYSAALEHCKIPSLSEYAVLLIELIRTKTLTEKHLFYAPKTTSAQALTHVDPCIVFASRLLSIVPVRMKTAWRGPICADLCGFTGMARSVQRTLRSLAEVIAVITYVDNSRGQPAPFNVSSYHADVQPNLPFFTPLMSGSGVLIQYIMENRVANMVHLETVFPDCLSLAQDLSSLFYFWYYAGQMIKVLYDDEPHSMDQTYRMFTNACHVLHGIPVALLGPSYAFVTDF
jgi:hypothetical protein